MAGPLDYQDIFSDDEIMQLWKSQGGQGQPDNVFMSALRAPGARTKYASQWNSAQNYNPAWAASRANSQAINAADQHNYADWAKWVTPTEGLSADGKSFGGVDFQTGRPLSAVNGIRTSMEGNLGNAAGNNINLYDPAVPDAAKKWAQNYEFYKNQNTNKFFGYTNPRDALSHEGTTYSDGTSKNVPLWKKQGLTPYKTPAYTGGNNLPVPYSQPGTKPLFTPPPQGGTPAMTNTRGLGTTNNRFITGQ